MTHSSETSLIAQAMSWITSLFEKVSSTLSNFKAFLKAFAKHDKGRWATTKICSWH